MESTPITTHWLPKALTRRSIRPGSSRAGVLMEILSAPCASTCPALSTLRMPPATQNGMSMVSDTRRTQPTSTLRPWGLAVMS
jgi:hypothetical protein